MPRQGGGSSTPRLLGSITDVSGTLGRPVKPAMTTGRVGAFVPNSSGALIVFELVFLVDLVALLVPMRHRFPAPQRSGHVRLARSVGIALRRPRGNLLARDRG